jgi:GT2 family glycosyltransferase
MNNMQRHKVKLVVGFITYGKSTTKYLPYFLPSLKEQSFKDFTILCFDNSEEENNKNLRYIKKNYPEIEIMRTGENLGFGRAYNKMIKRAAEMGAEYFLALNPDMILEPNAVERMVKAMDKDSSLAAVSPKILRWDFTKNRKTNIVDTCGIKLLPGLRFVDAEQGAKDAGILAGAGILGPSGAAGLYRLSALEKAKEDNQYFDELMFMYKEDCDLAYRLFLAGFKSKCVKEAIVYHDRSVSGQGRGNLEIALNRRNKDKQVKKWSFLGQQIIFVKYWKLQNWKNKLAIIWYEFKMLVFILLFEQYLLIELINLIKIKNKIKIYK